MGKARSQGWRKRPPRRQNEPKQAKPAAAPPPKPTIAKKPPAEKHVVADGAWVAERHTRSQSAAAASAGAAAAASTRRRTQIARRVIAGASSKATASTAAARPSAGSCSAAAGSSLQRQPGAGKGSSPQGAAADDGVGKRRRSEKNAARTATDVAAALEQVHAKAQEYDALSLGVQTRRTAIEAGRQLAAARARIEGELRALRALHREKEADLYGLIADPLSAWDDDVFHQLAMCEFVLDVSDEDAAALQPRQLGDWFRALALKTRHYTKSEEAPRFRGVYELHALRTVLRGSEFLCRALCWQLHRFKRLYASVLRHFGRFKRVDVEPGETMLDIMTRTHEEARTWRPPGNPGKQAVAFAAPVSQQGGVYLAEWREETMDLYHKDAGKTLSLRGTRSVAIAGSKRYLKSIPEEQRPKVVLQQFCDGVHWHNLALIGPQKLAVHWEPMGSDIHARASPVAAVRRAFESAPKADGWRLVSMRMDVQSDGYQCGPWAHWFRGRLYEYCSSAEAMAGGSFEGFLRASEGVRALDGLKGRAARAEAGEANTLLMHEERVRLRALLRAAARQGKLPWEDAKGLAFVPEGATRGEEEDLAEHDEMLEGDDEFHPIVLER